MTELTKEQLIEEAKLKIAVAKCHPNSEMARVECELYKIELASLEAEPVMSCIIEDGSMCVDGFGEYVGHSLPDKLPREYIRGWPLAYSDYAEGWNDCREAMLQYGNFRENKSSSTNNFREIPETSTSSPGTPAGWISCSDAVPAEYCDVILLDDLGNVFPGSWDKVFCPTRGGNKMAFVDKDGVEVESSTHWMPLPELPQEVDK
ncbi:DUF551 domain-containing protein [Escherichia coli]|uniref:DUF551 domain-containing protein n=2 Tax=Escherichia coli TaxID=562 RepID=UPI00397A0C8F